MAQFLPARGWAPPDLLAMQLRESLSHEYFIVAATRIHGSFMEIVVVGPNGIHLLYPQEWQGTIHAKAVGEWRVVAATGESTEVLNPALEIERCAKALRAFLRDEFPGLHTAIHQAVVLTQPDARSSLEEAVWPPVVSLSAVGEMIAMHPSPSPELDLSLREELALALRDRQLTHTQRASKPFIFRTGGKSVWTLVEAVQHMDRHPHDGIYHLRNGTLVKWFQQEGAAHFVELAHATLRQANHDDRVVLESFLISTGLVERPLLTLQPNHVDLGVIVSGESGSAVVRVTQGRGRGYLFGSLTPLETWVRVDPEHFAGASHEVVITVDTASLPIQVAPHEATVQVHSNAHAAPLPLSVRFRVVGMPSRLEAMLLRPLATMAVAALTGGMLGVLFALVAGLSTAGNVSGPLWGGGVGLLWGLVGAVYGALQPATIPSKQAIRRWARQLALWSVSLFAISAAFMWSVQTFQNWLGRVGSLPFDPLTAGVASALLAVLPAAVTARSPAISPAISAADRSGAKVRPSRLRYALLAGVVLLGLWLVVGLGLETIGAVAAETQGASEHFFADFEARLDAWTDELILRLYDRRAPAQSQ